MPRAATRAAAAAVGLPLPSAPSPAPNPAPNPAPSAEPSADPGSPAPPVANLFAATCPTRSVLDTITSRWGSLALVLLLQHPFRFSQLARQIGGVSEKMLAQTLRSLERDGFVDRTVTPSTPPQVTYALSPLGHQVATRLQVLTSWVEQNLAPVLAHRKTHANL